MFNQRRVSGIDFLWLIVILAASLGTRTWYLRTWTDGGATDGPVAVQGPLAATELKGLLVHLAEERLFTSRAPLTTADEQTAHLSPGYPWLLAWLDRLASQDTLNKNVRWLQCLLGALTPLLYYSMARRAFGSMFVAACAGLFCAFNPFWVINTSEIADGVVATFLLAVVIYLGERSVQDAGALSSFLFGISLAALVLVRAALLPFAFVAMLWFIFRCRVVRRGWLCALLAILGLFNSLLPWTYRNFRLLGDVVPIVSSAPFHLWVGNNPRATGGPMEDAALVPALSESRGQDQQAVQAELSEQTQKARYDRLMMDTWREVKQHPSETLQRRLVAGLGFWLGYDWLKNGRCWELGSYAAVENRGPVLGNVSAYLNGTLLFMILFGVLGWRWSKSWSYQSVPLALAAIWLPLPYLLGHAENLVGPRLPLDGVVLCFAAYALACMVAPYRSGLVQPADH